VVVYTGKLDIFTLCQSLLAALLARIGIEYAWLPHLNIHSFWWSGVFSFSTSLAVSE